MHTSIIPIYEKKAVRLGTPDYYVVIEYSHIPSMCSEFDPGPPDDFPHPEFWETIIVVFLMDPNSHTVEEINHNRMNGLYKSVTGRRDRIEFWRVMKYYEYLDKEEEEKYKRLVSSSAQEVRGYAEGAASDVGISNFDYAIKEHPEEHKRWKKMGMTKDEMKDCLADLYYDDQGIMFDLLGDRIFDEAQTAFPDNKDQNKQFKIDVANDLIRSCGMESGVGKACGRLIEKWSE